MRLLKLLWHPRSRIRHLHMIMRWSAADVARYNPAPVQATHHKCLTTASRLLPKHFRHLQWYQSPHAVTRLRRHRTQKAMATANVSPSAEAVDSLLARALPAPRYIRSGGAAAVVALAAHSELSPTRCHTSNAEHGPRTVPGALQLPRQLLRFSEPCATLKRRHDGGIWLPAAGAVRQR
jgi:hypothetical protein